MRYRTRDEVLQFKQQAAGAIQAAIVGLNNRTIKLKLEASYSG